MPHIALISPWLTLLPAVLALVVAVWKQEVILALVVAVFSSEIILAGGDPWRGFLALLDRIVNVFGRSSNTRILIFSLLIGALLMLLRRSGGVAAFVAWIVARGWARTPRQVSVITAMTGVVIFIETNLSVLTAGIFAQSLFDRCKMSRARLAYIIDSTCAPVSVLILVNGWGAYVLGLLDGYGIDNRVAVLVGTIPLNFYALTTLGLVFYTAWSSRVHFSMAQHEQQVATRVLPEGGDEEPTRKRYFLMPLATLVGGILLMMWYTGKGHILRGSGSTAVLASTVLALVVAYSLLRIDKRYRHREMVGLGFEGMAQLLPLVLTVLLALALGASMRDLGTGQFVARMVSGTLPLWLLAPALFIAGGVISFTTGTSWGTFGLLVPIAVPVAQTTGADMSLLVSAVLGGGVFGDHCSPISDTTIVASLASGCDLLQHVRTQLPYALMAAIVALIMYSVSGAIL